MNWLTTPGAIETLVAIVILVVCAWLYWYYGISR